jgi:multidrug resistance efflux pump
MRGERPAAGELAQHDAAALEHGSQRAQAGLDLVLVDPQRVRELVDRHGVGSEEQQRLELALDHATARIDSARTVTAPNDSFCSQSASPLL